MGSYIWLIIFPPDTQGSRNKTSGFIGHLRSAIWLLQGRIQSRLHLIKYTQSRCLFSCTWNTLLMKPIHTCAVIRNRVIIVIPVSLKERRTTLEQIMYFLKNDSFAVQKTCDPPMMFHYYRESVLCHWAVLQNLEMHANVLVLIQATTVHMV